MHCVVMNFADDLYVEAEDYEVDEDGDLVFLAADDEGEFESEDGMVEVGRVKACVWSAVFRIELEVEVEVEAEVECE